MSTEPLDAIDPLISADFARLEERPGLGLSVPLGREDQTPMLAALADGEHIVMIELDNLIAEGTAQSLTSGGYRYWYGVVASRADIQRIDPDEGMWYGKNDEFSRQNPG